MARAGHSTSLASNLSQPVKRWEVGQVQADGDGGRVLLPLEVMKLDRAGGSERANLKCLKKYSYVTGRDHRLTTQELGWHVHV